MRRIDHWRWRTEDGEEIRELLDLELVDVSVVAYPAYSDTSVSARALDHVKESKKEPPAPGMAKEINEARLKMAGL